MIQFDCISCERKFVGAEIEHCSFHPLKPKFAYGLNDGMQVLFSLILRFPCCDTKAVRFNTAINEQGCSAKFHEVKLAEIQQIENGEIEDKEKTVFTYPYFRILIG